MYLLGQKKSNKTLKNKTFVLYSIPNIYTLSTIRTLIATSQVLHKLRIKMFWDVYK